jgi:uncharacterized membrane protein
LTYVLGLSVVDYLMFNVVLSGLVLALGTIVVVRRVHRDNDAAHRRAMRSIRGRS